MNHRLAAVSLFALFAAASSRAAAQTPSADAAVSASKVQKPSLTAKLVDADQKALKKSATVEVRVSGIKLVDPASVKEIPAQGQGHLHYRVDNGPIIATTATKLSFHELSAGPHTFTVALAANDHSPLGPTQTMNLIVP